jgi:uncharacterized protein DUF6496
MARKYSKGFLKDVERAMKKRKRGTLRGGRNDTKVKSRKRAIAIGLSEARKKREESTPYEEPRMAVRRA